MNNLNTNFGKLFRLSLWPLSLIYHLVTSIRNLLFDWGIFSTYHVPVFSIGIGNLSVGGTGKTPFTSFLIRHFSGKKIAVLSRGYGRQTKGYREVSSVESAETVGDEIFMLFEKHQHEAMFFVSENRKLGVTQILKKYPETELIIFDDVFQHRYVKPSKMVLLSTFTRPFFKDFLLPFGLLRESRKGVKRADFIIFTKCQTGLNEELFLEELSLSKPVYFTRQSILPPRNHFGKTIESKAKVNVLSALANNHNFKKQVAKDFEINKAYTFLDHHRYTLADIQKIDFSFPCITTEKDFVKIKSLLNDERIDHFYTQKIETEFIINESGFLKEIDHAFNSFVPDL